MIYEDGDTIREEQPAVNQADASAVAFARTLSGMFQKQLAAATGIDQSDTSTIERGVANPSVSTLERIAKALGGNLLSASHFHQANNSISFAAFRVI